MTNNISNNISFGKIYCKRMSFSHDIISILQFNEMHIKIFATVESDFCISFYIEKPEKLAIQFTIMIKSTNIIIKHF